jgi:hypothetical protein
MTDCPHCRLRAGQEAVKHCERLQCGLSLTLSGRDRFKRKMRAELAQLITADVLYQAYTGEEDIYRLDSIRGRWIDDPIVTSKAHLWPERLKQLAAKRQQEIADNRKAVQQYTLGLFS